MQKLRELIEESGIGLTVLAKKSNVDKSTIWKIKQGQDPKLCTAKKILDAIGKKFKDLD